MAREQSPGERRADALVHCVGIVLAPLGAAALLFEALPAGDGRRVLAAVVYGLGLVATFSLSAAYNLAADPRRKAVLRLFDHAAIFLMIAGSYTPVALVGLGGPAGRALLAAVWLVALAGMALKLVWPGRFERASVALYLALGWAGLAALEAVIAALTTPVLLLLGAGGLLYTAGVVFHLWERLPYQNALWHGFVLAGAACHWVAVWALLAV